MHRTTSLWLCVILIMLISTVRESAAQVPVRNLGQPTATFPEPFSFVQGVREMPDGRIMVADPLGQVLIVADLRTGRADTIGQVGGGPREYRQPDNVFPLPGDSTLLVDLGNGRLTVIGPDGTFGETMPISQQNPNAAAGEAPGGRRSPLSGLTVVMPRAVDNRGRLYFTEFGGSPEADSQAVVRWDRGTRQSQIVGHTKRAARNTSTSGPSNARNVVMRPVPYSPQDGWAVGFDGRVAFVRVQPYRVEWLNGDGTVTRGDPVNYEPVRIGRAEQEQWGNTRNSGGLQVSISMSAGAPSMSLARGGGGGPQPEFDPREYEWPDMKPPFSTAVISVSRNGELWVTRSVRAGANTLFDVFDARGHLTAQVRMPEGKELLSFGDGVIYVIHRDEDDLLWLERYAYPS